MSRELLLHADSVIAATHGFAAPAIAAFVAMLVAWALREAWRGIDGAPVAVVALGLGVMFCIVVALWPGARVCNDLPVGALLATPLGIMAASGVVVGLWRRPAASLVRVGLVAMIVGLALNLLSVRTGLANAAAWPIGSVVAAAAAGLIGLSIGGVDGSTAAKPPYGGRRVVDQGAACEATDAVPGRESDAFAATNATLEGSEEAPRKVGPACG